MKRFLCLFICLLMTVLLSSCGAQNPNDFKYEELEDGTLKITDYIGKARNIAIPSEIDGKTVTCIGNGCFGLSSSVKDVVIPDSVVIIEDKAFSCARYLNHVTIKAKTITMGWDAFSASDVTRVDIESENVIVGEGAFSLCNKLNSFNLSNARNVRIDKKALLGTALTDISIIADDIVVGNEAFSATRLKKATIKCENLSLGTQCFELSVGLEEFYVTSKDNSTSVKSVSIADQCFSCCNLTSFNIASGAVRMGDEVFYNNGRLTEISVPKGTVFGSDIFKSCYKNPSINFID